MSSRLKAFIQYAIIFVVTIALIWFSLQGLSEENKWQYLKDTWQSANKAWLLAMAGIAMLSHVLRAARWRMLMVPSGHHPRLSHSFYSLMVGYLVNLVIPRGGEVSRCFNLYRLDKTPVDMSFGTVVVERIVDMLCLLILIAISFAVESEKLFQFIETLPIGKPGDRLPIMLLLYIGAACIVFAVTAFLILRRNEKLKAFMTKTWQGFKQGLSSVFRLENKGLFIVYSVSIWLLYFLMSYTVLQAFPSTNALGFGAVLSLFAIGSIAMAAPLPGGTGSYHVLVPQGLVFLYSVPQSEAVAFTFIFHGWQTAIMIVGGAISLLISSYIVRKKNY
ncbi:MAG TPA: lysylphosphatidylglycerol synthase transmembrane domain-containing protein [Ohtaekwangia sp.]|uniref:lysylphosphatidylglycerol synthase transmembrane domain-containing protein n=1 Tax=Ohtaekwangia sp. TaxID=2066019 RepID=UPI002F932D41